jgi:hypothetical protein
MAAAALGLAGLWVHQNREAATAAVLDDRLRHGLSEVAADSSLALRLRARIAAEADYRDGDHTRIIALLDEAKRLGDRTAIADAISLAHHCLLGPDDGDTRCRLAQDLIAASRYTNRRSDLLMGILWYTVDLVLAAEPFADRHLTELRETLADHQHLAVGYVVQAMDVMFAIRAGHFDQAEFDAKDCLDQGLAAGDVDALGWHGAHMVALRWFQGRIPELLPMLEDMVASPRLGALDHSFMAALAVAAGAAGDHRRAGHVLAQLVSKDLSAIPRSSSWLVTMYGVAEAAYLLGDVDVASETYRLLAPYGHLPIIASLGVACFGSVEHALGIAALTKGDTAAAIDHLRSAVRQNLALGHWPAATLSRCRLARALAASADTGEQAQAHGELRSARADAADLGMHLPEDPPDPFASTAGSPQLRRMGSHWRVVLGPRAVLVKNCRGMNYLAVLVANPRQEITAAELAMGPPSGDAPGIAKAHSTAQPLLDAEAVRQYRQRLAALEREVERCDALGDQERAIKVHEERDWLLAQLRSATGLAGRARSFAGADERARIAVGKAIRRALDWIARADPVIGESLARTVHTGQRCYYLPDACQ